MKQLEIKAAWTADFDTGHDGFDFDGDTGYEFADLSNVRLRLLLDIGEHGSDWSEHFSVLVVTPNNRPRNDPQISFILVPTYSFATLKKQLLRTIKSCERETWEDCLVELRKCFSWEWENQFR